MENTVKVAEITDLQKENSESVLLVKPQEIPPLKIDLGCGQNKREGFLGVDVCQVEGVDVLHDLEVFPWPWADNSVDETHSSHYIEHTQEIWKFMNELWRILKPEAKATIIAPYYNSMRCWQDPFHKHAISEASFLYYNRPWLQLNKLDHYPIKADFDFSFSYAMNPMWAQRAADARQFAITHYTNVVQDLIVHLIKKDR